MQALRTLLLAASLAFAALASPAQALPLTLDFGADGTMNFSSGGDFDIVHTSPATHDFTITHVGDAAYAGLVGLRGDIDGTFNFSPATGAVTSTNGVLRIFDADGVAFQTALDLTQITSLGSVITIGGTSFATGNQYSGTNPLLRQLARYAYAGDSTIGFIIPRMRPLTLTQLYNGGGQYGAYAMANVVKVPEPGTIAILGAGLVSLAFATRRRRPGGGVSATA